MLELVAAYARMCGHRLTRRREFGSLPWTEVLAAVPRELSNRRGQAAALARATRAADGEVVVVETPYGKLFLPAELPVREVYWLLRDVLDTRSWHAYESPTVRLEPGDAVVDCGAGGGLWALSILSRASTVLLVEPQPSFAATLRRTFGSSLADGRVTLVEAALGASDGRGALDISDGALAAVVRPSPGGPVAVRALDSLLDGSRVDFLKADVEGAERDLLLGARETLARWRPRLSITVYHDANDWRELLSLAREAHPGYRHELSGITQHGKPVLLRLFPGT